MGIIYCAQNMVNGKRYIGQSRNSLDRKRKDYVRYSRFQRSSGPGLLFAALREHGPESFEWSVMFDDVDDEDLDQLEIDTIAVYRSLAPGGYNSSIGGGKHSEETKRKFREKHQKEWVRR